MEDAEMQLLMRMNGQIDALSSMLLAVTVTVCRANPRAQRKIEEMALHHNLLHAEMVRCQLPAIQVQYMQQALDLLLATVRATLKADAKK